jgi:hypothetical protein
MESAISDRPGQDPYPWLRTARAKRGCMVPSNVALREEPFSGVKTRPESAAVHNLFERARLFVAETVVSDHGEHHMPEAGGQGGGRRAAHRQDVIALVFDLVHPAATTTGNISFPQLAAFCAGWAVAWWRSRGRRP